MQLLLVILLFCNVYMEPNELVTLEVKIDNVRNDDGHLLATLYNSESGYPDDAKKAFKSAKIKAGSQNNTFVFKDLPSGTYAIAILHDENDNGKLDKNIMGIPQEGYGSSNNVQKTFRAPNFEESKFTVAHKNSSINIRLNY